MLAGFKFNVSHQEIERILSEVEAWYETANEQAGVEWVPLNGLINFLFMDLGYEDMDEFEDAIQGSFPEFLGSFPHITMREEDGKYYCKVKKLVPGPPRRLHLQVTSTKQLMDTTFMQAVGAEVEIVHLEFRICSERRRKIDFLYNHIATAHSNLENHAAKLGDADQDAQSTEIMNTVAQLSKCLDLEDGPFELIVHDPEGISEFHPMDGVRIEEVDASELDPPAVQK